MRSCYSKIELINIDVTGIKVYSSIKPTTPNLEVVFLKHPGVKLGIVLRSRLYMINILEPVKL